MPDHHQIFSVNLAIKSVKFLTRFCVKFWRGKNSMLRGETKSSRGKNEGRDLARNFKKAYILKFLEGGNFWGFFNFWLKMSRFFGFSKNQNLLKRLILNLSFRHFSKKLGVFLENSTIFRKNRASFSKNKLVFRKVPKSARVKHFFIRNFRISKISKLFEKWPK